MKNRYQTSFIVDKELWIKFKSKTLKEGLSVSDNEVKKTIILLAENLKIIAEPGGAVAATALLNNKIDTINKTIVVMISGGNIDNELFSNIVKGI